MVVEVEDKIRLNKKGYEEQSASPRLPFKTYSLNPIRGLFQPAETIVEKEGGEWVALSDVIRCGGIGYTKKPEGFFCLRERDKQLAGDLEKLAEIVLKSSASKIERELTVKRINEIKSELDFEGF